MSAAAAATSVSRDPLPGAYLGTRIDVQGSGGGEARSRRPATTSGGGKRGQRRASVQVNCRPVVMGFECGL